MDFKNFILEEFNSDSSKHCMTLNFNKTAKCPELAKSIRQVGTKLFIGCKHDKLVHEKIWDSYLCSIALSPMKSESLAMSYANMSALLYHLCKYQDCVTNIDRALEITASTVLKVKLLLRKAKCFGKLGRLEKDDLFREAKSLFGKIGRNEDAKKELDLLMAKAKRVIYKCKVEVESTEDELDQNYNIIHTTSDLYTSSKKKKEPTFIRMSETSHLQILKRQEKKGPFKSLAVIPSEIHGKHLTAAKDIRPGEIVSVSKPYLVVPNLTKSRNFCGNCLEVVWSGVPCNNCPNYMFCSEMCAKEAAEKYHDVECEVLQFILHGDKDEDYPIHASLKAIVMAVKEFGSISSLKEEMDKMLNFTAKNIEGFDEDGKFINKSFLSILNFKNSYVEPEVLKSLMRLCCKTVIGLARFSSFFGEDCKLDDLESIKANADAVFISSLFLRVAIIMYNNGLKVDEHRTCCAKNPEQVCVYRAPCCERGFSINTISSLIPHSCDPNIKSMKTAGGKEFWYALQPIYKGESLFECYYCTFFELESTYRRESIAQVLHRNCNCVACTKDWPAVLIQDGAPMSYENMYTTVMQSREFEEEKEKFYKLTEKHGLCHQKVVNELKLIIEASYNYFGQPSAEVCAAITLLHYAFNFLFGIKLNMPDKCRTPVA